MPTLYSLTLTAALDNLRTDLSDRDATAYRWSDLSLQRALDKAVERYSGVSPWFQSQQIPVVVQCPLYPAPAGAFYIDRVEYPAGRWPKLFQPFLERKSPLISAPTWSNPPQVTGPAGSNLYTYAVTYTAPGGGETPGSPTFTFSGGVGTRTITNLPLGPYGVSGRAIYRTSAGGAQLKQVGSIPDNVTGSFSDTVLDATLGTAIPISNTTANLDQIELQIPPQLWPSDPTWLIEVTYATKHQLDIAGTTIPERHWHALYLGAVAFAMFSYLPAVNDNFEYADGHLRDRVDDHFVPIAWKAQCDRAMDDFEKALLLIKEDANSSILQSVVHWGDKPIAWERL